MIKKILTYIFVLIFVYFFYYYILIYVFSDVKIIIYKPMSYVIAVANISNRSINLSEYSNLSYKYIP